MAGTVVGKVGCRIGDGVLDPPNVNQAAFKVLYDFFAGPMTTAGYAQIHALNYGTAGTGTGFFDEAAPFGELAFFVVRMLGSLSGNAASARTLDYYLLFQWADTSTWAGAAPLGPGRLAGSTSTDGVGFAAAIREDGGDPWNGTTLVNGADAKGSPVWTAGASTLHVLDVSNTTGGSYAVAKDNLLRAFNDYSATNIQARVHMLADADTILFIGDELDQGFEQVNYVGLYEPAPALVCPLPLIAMSTTLKALQDSGSTNAHGSTIGTGTKEGGVLTNTLANGVVPYYRGQSVQVFQSLQFQPSGQVDGDPKYVETPVRIAVTTPAKGYLGNFDSDMLRYIIGPPIHQISADSTRTYFGDPALDVIRASVPWNPAVPAPRVPVSREGVEF